MARLRHANAHCERLSGTLRKSRLGAVRAVDEPEPTGYAEFPLENCQSVQHSETKTMSTNLAMDNYAFTAPLTRA